MFDATSKLRANQASSADVRGEQVFTCPSNVTSICILTVGGGGTLSTTVAS